MISPAEQKIIQIDVTNACAHKCSNCTRFCGHHRKPFMMDPAVFRQAVDAMQGFGGMVGVMGGEPTLHPEFESLALYIREKIATPSFEPLTKPVVNFVAYRNRHLRNVERNKRGLWTSLGRHYYRHFELIQDVFPYQCINDHMNDGLHQALLISRKELGIADEAWYPLRDNCWIQNLWSATITPKGAFFCEVAAALDMLFAGPGGWPIEPGWWRRTPAEFGAQLDWCELCSAPLRVPRLMAKAERDIVSPLLFEKLEQTGSPKLKQGQVDVFDTAHYREQEYIGNPSASYEWYLPDEDNNTRVAGTNLSIYPRDLTLVAGPTDATGAMPTIEQQDFQAMQFKDWCVLRNVRVRLAQDFAERIRAVVLNPGCLYVYNPRAPTDHDLAWVDEDLFDAGLLLLLNRRALAVRNQSVLPLNFQALAQFWPPEKRIVLDDRFDERVETVVNNSERLKTRLMCAHLLSLWSVLNAGERRIALYGAGKHTRFLLELLHQAALSAPCCIVDDQPSVPSIQNVRVICSDQVGAADLDVLVISSDAHAAAMTERAQALWPTVRAINPYLHFAKPTFVKNLSTWGERS